MAQLAATDVIHIRSQMGATIRVTAVFTTDADTNAYLAEHPEEGVIANAGGMVWIASMHDTGETRRTVLRSPP